MLQSIHDKVKGILGIIIVIFIGLVFGLWGIGDYLTGATEKYAARVGDIEISQSEFEQALARQRQRLEEMFKGQIPDSPAFEKGMKEQVLEQLISQRVLLKATHEEGFRVADPVLAHKIRSMQAFQQDGQFDSVAYQAIVQSQGMSIREFENRFRSDLRVQQLQQAIMGSAIVGKAELNILNRIMQQSRDIRYLQFDDSQFMASVEVSEEEIEDYFERNKARFMHPETVTVSYVELSYDDIAEDIPVDEEAVRRLYDEYVASIASASQRKARHILINVPVDADDKTQAEKKAQAEALLAKIRQGESFETLARENSEDPGSAASGGDLGWVAKGMMVPEFESALFKLKKGQVSDVVKSSFGFHIIRLDDIKADKVASFEAKKDELIKQYKAQIIEDRFYEKSELMATTAYENDQSLQEVADAVGLEIKTAGPFSRAQGTGIAANDRVRSAAFTSDVISEGRNSEIIELDKKHVVVLRVDSHTEASPKKLDEVRAQIVSAIKAQKAREKSQAAALSALAKLEQGESMESSEFTASARLVKPGPVKRDDKTVDPQILREAFTMARPVNNKPAFKVVELPTGTAVVELKAVSYPQQASPEQLQALSRQLENQQANRDMAMILDYLKSKTEIVRGKTL